MSLYSIESTTLKAIGDAIREKEGTTAPIPVADFAERIADIKTGEGGGGSGLDIDTDIEEMMINEVGEEWVTLAHNYLNSITEYAHLYAVAVIEAYGQEDDLVFPSGDFALNTSAPSPYLVNLNTLERASSSDIAFNGSLQIKTGDYMKEVSPGVWRMMLSLYNNTLSTTKSLFSSSYNWGQDIRIPYLLSNCGTGSSSSNTSYQISVSNTTFGLDAECWQINGMYYKYRHNFNLRGSKYCILKYDSSTSDVQYSSPSLLSMPDVSYYTNDVGGSDYVSVENLHMKGDSSSYGKYAYFFKNAMKMKRVSFKNCRLYAYFRLDFYLFDAYADFSGVTWFHATYDNTTPQNGMNFYISKSDDWKERVLYFVEHMPVTTKTIAVNLPSYLDSAWGQENVFAPLAAKGYSVSATLSAYVSV